MNLQNTREYETNTSIIDDKEITRHKKPLAAKLWKDWKVIPSHNEKYRTAPQLKHGQHGCPYCGSSSQLVEIATVKAMQQRQVHMPSVCVSAAKGVDIHWKTTEFLVQF